MQERRKLQKDTGVEGVNWIVRAARAGVGSSKREGARAGDGYGSDGELGGDRKGCKGCSS